MGLSKREGEIFLDDDEDEEDGLLASGRGIVEDAQNAVAGGVRRAVFGSWFG